MVCLIRDGRLLAVNPRSAAADTPFRPSHLLQVATKELIDSSFRKLRSAEGAFELLRNFKSIKSQGAIQQQMMSKLQDILEQFMHEMDEVLRLFHKNKDNPPITKNQPQVAGAIKWCRSIFTNIKRTMLTMESVEDEKVIKALPIGTMVYDRFKVLAKTIMKHEKALYNDWTAGIQNTTLNHLKQPLLRRDPETEVIAINFHPDLTLLIREAKYLDRMDLSSPVPEVAVNLALQEEKFKQWLEGLHNMMDKYYEVGGPGLALRGYVRPPWGCGC